MLLMVYVEESKDPFILYSQYHVADGLATKETRASVAMISS